MIRYIDRGSAMGWNRVSIPYLESLPRLTSEQSATLEKLRARVGVLMLKEKTSAFSRLTRGKKGYFTKADQAELNRLLASHEVKTVTTVALTKPDLWTSDLTEFARGNIEQAKARGLTQGVPNIHTKLLEAYLSELYKRGRFPVVKAPEKELPKKKASLRMSTSIGQYKEQLRVNRIKSAPVINDFYSLRLPALIEAGLTPSDGSKILDTLVSQGLKLGKLPVQKLYGKTREH
jgi:hypothetical protein